MRSLSDTLLLESWRLQILIFISNNGATRNAGLASRLRASSWHMLRYHAQLLHRAGLVTLDRKQIAITSKGLEALADIGAAARSAARRQRKRQETMTEEAAIA